MTRDDAVKVAAAAAQGAFVLLEPKPMRKWWQALTAARAHQRTLEELAAFKVEHPAAGAEALYRFAKGADYEAEPWGANVALEAACCIFCAALSQMLLVVARQEAEARRKAKPPPPVSDRWMGERTFEDTAPGFLEQTTMKQG